ncbi:MAG: rhodanese-like domain-containing protein [Magnetococcales bacterium]|nr:rhodanese-like domain-containing protein [Magnetococcales bacterium]
MVKKQIWIKLIVAIVWISLSATGFALPVNISKDLAKFTVKHGSQSVTVMRNQDTRAIIEPDYAKVARNCPPFCIQPIEAAPGVKTIGELELIQFMINEINSGSGLLIDARTPDWHAQGVIPGSINIPYTDITPALGANAKDIEQALIKTGATKSATGWDFSQAKKLALWCNGPWCGQSQAAILGLLEMKYPAEKLLYYRGGLQMWKLFGLTVVPPSDGK